MRRFLVWLLVAAVVVWVVRLLLPVLLLAGACWLVLRVVRARRAARAALCARADAQHAAVMAGDLLAGVHGAYPPVAVA